MYEFNLSTATGVLEQLQWVFKHIFPYSAVCLWRRCTTDDQRIGAHRSLAYGRARLPRWTGATALMALYLLGPAAATPVARSLASKWYTADPAPAPAPSSTPCVSTQPPRLTSVYMEHSIQKVTGLTP